MPREQTGTICCFSFLLWALIPPQPGPCGGDHSGVGLLPATYKGNFANGTLGGNSQSIILGNWWILNTGYLKGKDKGQVS